MKKLSAVILAALFVLMLVPSVFAAGANITKEAKISASSENISDPENAHPATNLVDGDMATFWEAASGKNNGEYFTLTFDDKYDFDKIVIHWGGGRVKENALTVSVGDSVSSLKKVDCRISRENPDNTHFDDTVTFTATGKVIRVTAGECEKEQLQCWEVEVFGTKAADDTTGDDTTGDDTTGDDTTGDDTAGDDTTGDDTTGDDTAGDGGDQGNVPHDGVESFAVWAVLFAAAAAGVVFTVRKVRA